MVSWCFLPRDEDEEAAARAHVGQAHLLPLVLQVHLVGEAELDVVHQLRPARGLGRLGGRQVEVDVQAQADRGRIVGVGQAIGLRVARVVAGAARVDLDVDLARPVDRAFLDQADLPGFLGREAALDHLAVDLRHRVGHRQRFHAGDRRVEHALDLLGQHVVVEFGQRRRLQRLGVRGQQLGEEGFLRRIGPADQLHAFVEVLHQLRQLHQELLAQQRGALGLHAHHQVAPGALEARVTSEAMPSRRTASTRAWLQTCETKSRR